MKWTQPTPDHYWDTKTMSWKLAGESEFIMVTTTGSTTPINYEDWKDHAKRCIRTRGYAVPTNEQWYKEKYEASFNDNQ